MTHAQKHMNTPEGMRTEEIEMTAGVLMIAGSETTATLLSGLTYHLLKTPNAYKKLVAEIRGAFRSEDQITMASTYDLKYLHAVLKEGLRMFPPVPGSLTRVVAPE